ncbi:MAG TPA: hypothetical protein VGI81_13565 [Tepidisphaeraceae bacterium]|jgi:hypothetical protein
MRFTRELKCGIGAGSGLCDVQAKGHVTVKEVSADRGYTRAPRG